MTKNIKKVFSNYFSELFSIVTKKDVFPYNYVNVLDILKYKQLSSKKNFYNIG